MPCGMFVTVTASVYLACVATDAASEEAKSARALPDRIDRRIANSIVKGLSFLAGNNRELGESRNTIANSSVVPTVPLSSTNHPWDWGWPFWASIAFACVCSYSLLLWILYRKCCRSKSKKHSNKNTYRSLPKEEPSVATRDVPAPEPETMPESVTQSPCESPNPHHLPQVAADASPTPHHGRQDCGLQPPSSLKMPILAPPPFTMGPMNQSFSIPATASSPSLRVAPPFVKRVVQAAQGSATPPRSCAKPGFGPIASPPQPPHQPPSFGYAPACAPKRLAPVMASFSSVAPRVASAPSSPTPPNVNRAGAPAPCQMQEVNPLATQPQLNCTSVLQDVTCVHCRNVFLHDEAYCRKCGKERAHILSDAAGHIALGSAISSSSGAAGAGSAHGDARDCPTRVADVVRQASGNNPIMLAPASDTGVQAPSAGESVQTALHNLEQLQKLHTTPQRTPQASASRQGGSSRLGGDTGLGGDANDFVAQQLQRLEQLQKLRTPPSGSPGRPSASSRGTPEVTGLALDRQRQQRSKKDDDDEDLEAVLNARVERKTGHRFTLASPKGPWLEVGDNASEAGRRSVSSNPM